MAAGQHKEQVRANLKVGVVTASDTRTRENDKSGVAIREMFEGAGHKVTYYEIVPDAPSKSAHASSNANFPTASRSMRSGNRSSANFPRSTGIAIRSASR